MGDLIGLKTSLLCIEAKRWIGILEESENSGQLIRLFQCSVDGQANKEPWCMAFAQYCIKMADKIFTELFPKELCLESSIFRSEHCMTTWNKSPHLQLAKPLKGSLCVWQKYDGNKPTTSGHTGIVTEVHNDESISVVEGNTASRADGTIEREGDGVYLKRYNIDQLNRDALRLKGFLRVW